MSDLPAPEINPAGPDISPTPATSPVEPSGPEIAPAETPQEAPAGLPTPDDGRPYD